MRRKSSEPCEQGVFPTGAVVTGAAGFIGGHLVEALASRGEVVRALVRVPGPIPPYLEKAAEVVVADLSKEAPARVFKDVETVFHCAAQVRLTKDPKDYEQGNVLATHNVLESCAELGVRRVVYFSTAAVHGEHINHHNADETSAFADPPPNQYVSSKIRAEQVAVDARRRGLDVTILRPGWVWGPRDPNLLRIGRLLKHGLFVLPGPGTNFLHLAFVGNLVQASLDAATSPEASNETLLIHDDSGITSRLFIERLAVAIGHRLRIISLPAPLVLSGAGLFESASRAIGLKPMVSYYQLAILARDQGFSVEKARRVLGFRPRIPFEEAMDRTVRWLKLSL